MPIAPPLVPFLPLPNPLAAIPRAINHLLAREQWARSALEPFVGQVALLVMAPFELRLAVDSGGLIALAATGAAPAVRIELPAAALAQVMGPGGSAALTRHIKLEGDAQFAQAIAHVAQNLRWEPEEDLSQVIGDVAARRAIGTAREIGTQTREAVRRLGENFADYLLEENPQLIRPRHLEGLAGQVRTLRDDIARLEKRLDRLGGS